MALTVDSPSERVVSAVLPPQELAFNMSVENLRQKLAEINLESAVLLHKRAKHIEEQNNELLRKMKRLEDQNNALKVTIDSMWHSGRQYVLTELMSLML
jgi:hypothetical protein